MIQIFHLGIVVGIDNHSLVNSPPRRVRRSDFTRQACSHTNSHVKNSPDFRAQFQASSTHSDSDNLS